MCWLLELPHAITNNDSYCVNVQLLTLDCDGSYYGTKCCQSVCLSTPSRTNNECQHTHVPLASAHCNKHKTVNQRVSTLHHMTVTKVNTRRLPSHQLTATNTHCQSACLYTTSHDSNESQHMQAPLAPAHCNKHTLCIQINVKQSHYRSRQALRVPGS